MRKMTLFTLVCMLLVGCGIDKQLTLAGHIDGLQEGDTIFLSAFSLPNWTEDAVDTFFAHKPGEFLFKTELDHTTFFLLSHSPKDTPRIESCISGATILARPGDKIDLRGTIYAIGALNKTGGFYSDPLIARFESLEEAYNSELIEIYKKLLEARAAQQEDSVLFYQQAYNDARRPKMLVELSDSISGQVNDNEYAVYQYMLKLYGLTATQVEQRYEAFNLETKHSYMGQKLFSMLHVLKNIEPGHTPSEFAVTDMNGNVVHLSDYRGKYLLIYHWGLCPGTIWVHPKLLDMYEQYHEKGFEVLGFTGNDFFTVHADLKNVPQIMPLFNQPWATVFTDSPGNEFIVQGYYFSGVPILMLISPDGTTIARGYSEVYDQVKETLKENL